MEAPQAHRDIRSAAENTAAPARGCRPFGDFLRGGCVGEQLGLPSRELNDHANVSFCKLYGCEGGRLA